MTQKRRRVLKPEYKKLREEIMIETVLEQGAGGILLANEAFASTAMEHPEWYEHVEDSDDA